VFSKSLLLRAVVRYGKVRIHKVEEPQTVHRKTTRLPPHLAPFFWDVRFEDLSVCDSPRFIMSRLMEHGDEEAFRFLLREFSRDELRATLRTSRSLSRRARVFWAIFLDVEVESCTARRYPTPFGKCFLD
jgi:hypothetical protein